MADTKKPDTDSDADLKGDTGPEEETNAPVSVDDGDTPDTASDTVTGSNDSVDEPSEDETLTIPQEAEVPEASPAPLAVDAVDKSRRGGFAPAFIGGILAAFLGFIAARTEVLDPYLPAALKGNGTSEAVAALQESEASQAQALDALRGEIAAIDQPDLAPVTAQLAEIQAEMDGFRAESEARQARLQEIDARLNPLDARLETLEKRPMTEGASEAAIAAYDRELVALREAIATQRADVEMMIDEARAKEAAARALEEGAASAARNAQSQAIATRLIGALDNGAAYAPILAEMAAAGITVPDVLNASANDGVATLAALGSAFPADARAALSAARAAGDKGGIGGFLQRHLGARSLEPREGNDPDAILSRAEAAMKGGDLSIALEEIAALPETARAQMQTWVDAAETRLVALQAANELAQSLNTN